MYIEELKALSKISLLCLGLSAFLSDFCPEFSLESIRNEELIQADLHLPFDEPVHICLFAILQ